MQKKEIVSMMEETRVFHPSDEVKKKEVEPSPGLRAFDEGDTVRFERKTPFGLSKYSKKKSELNEVERATFERDRKPPAGK